MRSIQIRHIQNKVGVEERFNTHERSKTGQGKVGRLVGILVELSVGGRTWFRACWLSLSLTLVKNTPSSFYSLPSIIMRDRSMQMHVGMSLTDLTDLIRPPCKVDVVRPFKTSRIGQHSFLFNYHNPIPLFLCLLARARFNSASRLAYSVSSSVRDLRSLLLAAA